MRGLSGILKPSKTGVDKHENVQKRKKDMKKVMSAVLAAAMVVGTAGNVVTVSAKEKYDLTLYSVNTTDPDFEDWLANVEDATGLNINVIAAPTDTDTRQQKITTMLSTGDTSVDVIEINDEMSAAFKNSGWLEGLNDTVMTDDIIDQFAQGYVKDMIADKRTETSSVFQAIQDILHSG